MSVPDAQHCSTYPTSPTEPSRTNPDKPRRVSFEPTHNPRAGGKENQGVPEGVDRMLKRRLEVGDVNIYSSWPSWSSQPHLPTRSQARASRTFSVPILDHNHPPISWAAASDHQYDSPMFARGRNDNFSSSTAPRSSSQNSSSRFSSASQPTSHRRTSQQSYHGRNGSIHRAGNFPTPHYQAPQSPRLHQPSPRRPVFRADLDPADRSFSTGSWQQQHQHTQAARGRPHQRSALGDAPQNSRLYHSASPTSITGEYYLPRPMACLSTSPTAVSEVVPEYWDYSEQFEDSVWSTQPQAYEARHDEQTNQHSVDIDAVDKLMLQDMPHSTEAITLASPNHNPDHDSDPDQAASGGPDTAMAREHSRHLTSLRYPPQPDDTTQIIGETLDHNQRDTHTTLPRQHHSDRNEIWNTATSANEAPEQADRPMTTIIEESFGSASQLSTRHLRCSGVSRESQPGQIDHVQHERHPAVMPQLVYADIVDTTSLPPDKSLPHLPATPEPRPIVKHEVHGITANNMPTTPTATTYPEKQKMKVRKRISARRNSASSSSGDSGTVKRRNGHHASSVLGTASTAVGRRLAAVFESPDITCGTFRGLRLADRLGLDGGVGTAQAGTLDVSPVRMSSISPGVTQRITEVKVAKVRAGVVELRDGRVVSVERSDGPAMGNKRFRRVGEWFRGVLGRIMRKR